MTGSAPFVPARLPDGLGSCVLADLQEAGAAISTLPRLSGTGVVWGRVRTVRCPPHDVKGGLDLIDLAEPGDVLVLTSTGAEGSPSCMAGDQMAFAALCRGVRAFVIDGTVRDIGGIRELGFSVHARGTEISGASASGPYEIDCEVSIDGLVLRAGDYIVLDDDGIVRVPADELDDLLRRAEAAIERERRVREAMRGGLTLREASAAVDRGDEPR